MKETLGALDSKVVEVGVPDVGDCGCNVVTTSILSDSAVLETAENSFGVDNCGDIEESDEHVVVSPIEISWGCSSCFSFSFS